MHEIAEPDARQHERPRDQPEILVDVQGDPPLPRPRREYPHVKRGDDGLAPAGQVREGGGVMPPAVVPHIG